MLSDKDVDRIASAIIEKAREDVGIRDVIIGSAMGEGAIPLYGREARREPCSCCLIEPAGPNAPENRMCTTSGAIGTLKDSEEREWCSEINIVADGRCARARNIREAARECKEKYPEDTAKFFTCYAPAFSKITGGSNPGTPYQEEGEEPIVSETEAFEKRLEYELKKSGFMAEPEEGNTTTVQCPICHKVIEIPQYDKVSRSDALIKHVKEEHTGWIAKLKEGNPGAPVLYEARLWRKWANMDDVIQPFATEQEAYDYLTHLKYIAKAGDKITVKRSQEWDIKVLHRETIEKDGQYWAIRKPYEPIPTEPKGGNPGEYVTITDPGKTTLASRR